VVSMASAHTLRHSPKAVIHQAIVCRSYRDQVSTAQPGVGAGKLCFRVRAGRYSAAGQVKARSSEKPQLRWEFGDQVLEVEDGLVGDAEAS
jgi:hypothetical protein